MFSINIRLKITLLIAGILFILEATQLIFNWYGLKSGFYDNITKQTASVTSMESSYLSYQLATQFTSGTVPHISGESLSEVKKLVQGLQSVYVLTQSGEIIGSYSENGRAEIVPQNVLNYIQKKHAAKGTISGMGHKYFINSIPTNPVSYVAIVLSYSDLSNVLWKDFRHNVWISIIIYFIVIFITYFSIYIITRPALKLLSHTRQVGSGELTHLAKIYSNDEFGMLTKAFNETTSKLKEVIIKIKDVTKEVIDISSSLSDTYNGLEKSYNKEISGLKLAFNAINSVMTGIDNIANTMEGIVGQYSDINAALNEFMSSIGEVDNSTEKLTVSVGDISVSIEEIASSIKEVSNNAGELSKYIEESTASMNQMRSAVKDISESSIHSANLSETVKNEAIDGLKSADETLKGIGKIKQATDGIVASINSLVQGSNQIMDVLDGINQIADKTNLLALNAAIIANQAGEHGKGFAVVAQEINDLAERTKLSTTEIDRIIKSINVEMQKAKIAADTDIKSVDDGINLTKTTHSKLTIIKQSSQDAGAMALSIARMVKEQSIGINTIAEAQEMISKVSKQILSAMNDQVSGTTQINQTIEGIKQLTNKLHIATSEQTRTIQQITKNADTTMHSITSVNQTLGMQKQENKTAVDTIENSLKIIEENISMLNHTKSLLINLRERLSYLSEGVDWFRLDKTN